MRFAPPRDAILNDLPRSPHPTPAHHTIDAVRCGRPCPPAHRILRA